ncbi:hypothetical protein DM02DRAFT_191142 [Periconia macrospinosa]|uniref:Uncharacterized protein n=1 Tax=Periconia macrospinosa TaxID=97972 RepID=A0A2V1D8N5_9PLEO|nr:hypothetical protein DM02DRAFT_191142 [Periconia macrospinosa]
MQGTDLHLISGSREQERLSLRPFACLLTEGSYLTETTAPEINHNTGTFRMCFANSDRPLNTLVSILSRYTYCDRHATSYRHHLACLVTISPQCGAPPLHGFEISKRFRNNYTRANRLQTTNMRCTNSRRDIVFPRSVHRLMQEFLVKATGNHRPDAATGATTS